MIRAFLERIGILHKKSWEERNFVAILIGAAVIFVVISLAIGLQQSVWFDEAYSIMLAKQDVGRLLHLTSIDTHPPLYYLLLKGWASLFGWSELALRSLSVLAGGGAIVFGGLLVRRMFGARAAVMTLPFVVFAPFLIRYGWEIRMYALASLIGIAATYVLVRAVEADRAKQWKLYVLYAVLVALGVYTLYYTAVLWIAHVVWLLWLAKSKKEPVFRQRWWIALGASVVLFIPWLPTFVTQLSNGALAPISQPLTMDNLVGIVSFMFVYQPSWQLNALMSLVVLFVIVALTYVTIRAVKRMPSKQKPYLLFLGLYLLVPITVIALVSLTKPMYVERYLAHVAIGGYLFVGVVVWLGTLGASKKLRVIGAALLAVLLLGVSHLAAVGNYNFQRLQQPPVKEIAASVDGCAANKTILAADPYVAIELAYYLPDCDIHFYSQWPTLSGGYAPLSGSPLQVKDVQKELAGSHEVVYVYYDKQPQQLPQTLRQTSDISIGALHAAHFSAE